MSVIYAKEHLDKLEDCRRDAILDYVEQFRSAKIVPQMIVPAYALPNSQCLLLDRNHRTEALAIANVEFELTLFSIHGPIDGKILPDLERWKQ